MAKASTAEAEELLTVKVFSPYQVFYQGTASSVSAINSTGPFDVLVGHINFFSILVSGTVAVNTGTEPLEYSITHGIIHVRTNNVTLFVFGLNLPAPEDDKGTNTS